MNTQHLLAATLLCAASLVQAEVTVTPLWESAVEFRGPESVLPDMPRQRMYVSNVDGTPTDKDGKGFISLLGTDGSTLKLEWVTGLNAPKGLAQVGDRLFVSDIDELVEIDVDKGAVTHRYLATGARFLNDVSVDASGNVYVSDMLTNRIYRLHEGRFGVWLDSPTLENPNGLKVVGDQLYVGTWGVMDTGGFSTKVPGRIKIVSLSSKQIRDFAGKNPVGNLDGLEMMSDGSVLVTDWLSGGLYHVQQDGSVRQLSPLAQGSADIGYIADERTVLVPMMNDGKVIALRITP